MGFELNGIGVWSPTREFTVERSRIAAYAEATNDPIEAHRSGDLAPPVFAVVPVSQAESGVIVEAREPAARLTPEEENKVLHVGHDIVIHRPIEPGMNLRMRGTTIGIKAKSSGTLLVNKVETEDASGAPVNVQYFSLLYLGVRTDASGGEEAPPTGVESTDSEPIAEVVQRLDSDQTFRYAPASGDDFPIHLDHDFAVAAGMPGVIVHGLCTMAFVSHAAIERLSDGDPRCLRRLAVRFAAPAFPGQRLTTSFRQAARPQGDAACFAFATLNDEGDVVLRAGVAVLEA